MRTEFIRIQIFGELLRILTKALGAIKCGELRDQSRAWYILKKDSAPWSQ
jgi:hypothetical protein